jgi:hypothetical protein
MKIPCTLSQFRYECHEPCPALYWADGRYWCSWVNPKDSIVMYGLAIGRGCCSSLFNTYRNDMLDWRSNS